MIGSSYFLGFLFSSIFVLRLADIYGRKIVLYIVVISTFWLLFLYLIKSLVLLYLGMFITGAFIVSRYAISYVLLNELAGEENRS